MADWKEAEAAECRDVLYVEEINANEGVNTRLTNIPTSATVEHLKRAIAVQLQQPQKWTGIRLAFGSKTLSNCTYRNSNV